MARMYQRFGVEWGNHPRQRTSAANWKLPLRWNASAKKGGVRRRVFCASLADVFDNQVRAEWRADLWALIAACDSLDWLLLTKRPQNIPKMLPTGLGFEMMAGAWPWPNVWLGTTAEDQERYDQRMPHLAAVNCAKRFVSYEPALGPVDFLSGASPGDDEPWAAKIDLIIAGGESGPHARPMRSDWAASARDQCQTAGIYFHFKQWGEWVERGQAPNRNASILFQRPQASVSFDGSATLYSEACRDWIDEENLTDETAIRVGKSAAGRLLDGVTHDGMPG